MVDTSLERMQTNLNLLEELLDRFRMELNIEKTEYMTCLEGELHY